MTYENIKFHLPHMAVREPYFYIFDYERGLLSVKQPDATIAFQYPIDEPSSFTQYELEDVKCLQYDGFNFWTLQDFSDETGFLISQWQIDNYICRLVKHIPKFSGDIIYDSNTFSVEYYSTYLSSDVEDGTNLIYLNEYSDLVVYEGTVLCIGPNKYGKSEIVTVSGVVDTGIVLNSPLDNNFYYSDTVTITPSILLFNNYYVQDDSQGSLIQIDLNSGEDLSVVNDSDYLNVKASKFTRLQDVIQDNPDIHTLAFVQDTNLKLKNMSDIYRYKAISKATDMFDDDDLNLDLWEVSNGNPTLQSGTLFFSTVGVGHDSIQSIYKIVGDFSLTASGSFGTFTTFSGGYSLVNQYINLDFIDESQYGISLYYDEDMYYPESYVVAEYRFDGDTLDSSSYGNDGSLSGSPTLVEGVDGYANSAYSFDGTNSIVVPASDSLNAVGTNNDDFSVVFWIKLNQTATGSWRMITNKSPNSSSSQSSGYRTWAMWAPPSNNTIYYVISTTSNTNDGAYTVGEMSVGSWMHVAYVKSGNTINMYLDKVLDVSRSFDGTVVTNTGPISIGDDSYYPGVSADIDNYRVFSKALSLEDITELYYSDLNRSYEKDPKMVVTTTTDGNIDNINEQLICSGIAPQLFNFRLYREGTNTTFGYQTVTNSGVASEWYDFDSFSTPSSECSVSLGMKSTLVTVSAAAYKDIVYDSGYIRFPSTDQEYYGIMGMDNVKSNQSTIVPIYAIDVVDDNLYRLQKNACYYGSDYTWSTYNFQLSPIRSFVDFLTVDSDSHILPATGRNTTVVSSVTFDQYGQGIVNKPVTFTDDDDVGFITTKVVYTDIFYNTGEANTAYTSGTSLRVVEVLASVTQLD